MTINKRIKDRREALGLTMQELATAIEVKAWQTVQQWEKEGGTAPKRSRLEKVAKVLKVSPEWLITGREPDNQPRALQFAELNGLEAQLVMLYRSLSDDDKHALSVYANDLANKHEPERRSTANSYPGVERRSGADILKKI
jgi:transcriptional regulator with XRE-family HTH domain